MKKFIIPVMMMSMLATNVFASEVVTSETKETPAIANPIATITPDVQYIEENDVKAVDGELEIFGIKPQLMRTEYTELETMVNEKIDAYYEKSIADAKENGSRSIDFTYKLYKSGDIGSIVIYFSETTASTINQAFSVNFNFKTGEEVTLQTILGLNAEPLVNQVIVDTTRDNEEYVVNNFNGIDVDQSFYVEDDVLKVILSNSQMEKRGESVAIFELSNDDISTVYFNNSQIIEKDDVMYLPIRESLEGTNLAISWNEATKEISLENKTGDIVKLTVDKNVITTSVGTREIEGNVFIHNDSSYVPLSCYEVALGGIYTVDSDKNVTISFFK